MAFLTIPEITGKGDFVVIVRRVVTSVDRKILVQGFTSMDLVNERLEMD
jgi:hypothetical protein